MTYDAEGRSIGAESTTGEVNRLKDALGLHPSPSTYGKVVQRALVGYRDFESQRTGRPYELPDLLPLGLPDLLVGQTRRTLCPARDRAL